MSRYLSIVETAYRATVEEQDDTGVWFTRAIQGAGAEVTLLLRGDGVSYAQNGHDARGLSFGTRAVRVAPELDHDIEAMLARGSRVLVVNEDLAARGIPDGTLLSGLERVNRGQVAGILAQHDRILRF